MSTESGKPMFENLQYCIRCCMPETQEGLVLDEMGVCRACISSEQKMHINWVEKERKLREILEEAKRQALDGYDCIIPISGGKDSVFQMHVLVNVYHMKPLAVTFSHNWFSKTGWYNLVNALEMFNVDHVMFTPNRDLVNRIARRSLEMIGDVCWHCHAGLGSFPLKMAVAYGIPLLVYGESVAESAGRSSYLEQTDTYDREYFTRVSAKVKPHDMVCEYIEERDLVAFQLPSVEELERYGVKGIHLGDYIFWDDERQTEFIRDVYGWKETDMEPTYKGYKSVECIMPGMHDFTCYLKRGFGRASFHASIDVRNGLLTRREGFELANKYDPVRPEAMDYYLKITGLNEDDVYKTMEKHRVSRLKGKDIPIKQRSWKCKERLLPFAQQLVEEYRSADFEEE